MDFSWIGEVLKGSFPGADWAAGVDLNKDGAIQESEKLRDFDSDSVVGSVGDWEKYLADNYAVLKKNVAFFRSMDLSSMRADNPFHEIMALESAVASEEEINTAYMWMYKLLDKARGKKGVSIRELMKEMGVGFSDYSRNSLLTENLSKWTGLSLGKELTSFVVQAVSHELGNSPDSETLSPEELKALVLKNRGRARLKRREYAEALSDFNEVIRLAPYLSEKILPFRAMAKSGTGNAKGAVDDYSEIIKRHPKCFKCFINRGVAKMEFGDLKGAIEDFNEGARLNAKAPTLFLNRGTAKSNLGDLKGAMEDYSEAIRLDPDFAGAFNNRGLVKMELGDYRGAIKDFDEALRLEPNEAQIIINHEKAKKTMEIQ